MVTEEALVRSAHEWRDTFDSIEFPILVLDCAGRIVRLNLAAQRLADQPFEALLGRDLERLAAREPWREARRLAACAEPAPTDLPRRVPGEDGRMWELTANPASSPAPASRRTIIVARDVTGTVRLEESLRRAEGMSTMGALVAGVAHEVRNPLFAISATIDALEATGEGHADAREILDVLRGQIAKLTRLMQDLLDYGRPPVISLASSSLGEVALAAVRDCGPAARAAGVELVLGVHPGFGPLRVDRARIGHALRNLVENAIQHAPAGSAVRLEGRSLAVSGKQWLELDVLDSGAGFRPEDLPQLFQPFFTRRRGGTGLGLGIVQRVVEAHGGRVIAGNHAGGGARVTIALPAVHGADGD